MVQPKKTGTFLDTIEKLLTGTISIQTSKNSCFVIKQYYVIIKTYHFNLLPIETDAYTLSSFVSESL